MRAGKGVRGNVYVADAVVTDLCVFVELNRAS